MVIRTSVECGDPSLEKLHYKLKTRVSSVATSFYFISEVINISTSITSSYTQGNWNLIRFCDKKLHLAYKDKAAVFVLFNKLLHYEIS